MASDSRLFARILTLLALALLAHFVLLYLPLALLWTAAAAVLLLAAVYVSGFAALSLARSAAPGYGYGEYLGAGLGVTCAYFFALAALRWLNGASIGAFFAANAILAALILRRPAARAGFAASLRAIWQRPLLEFAGFALPLVYSLLPTLFYDSLAYVVGLPNFILQNHGFVQASQYMFANLFIYYETSLIPAVFLGVGVARLFHFLLGVLFLLALADFCCREWQIRHRLVLVMVLVSLPMSLFLLATEKGDLISAFFIFLAIKADRDERRVLPGVFWGLAIGCKSFSALALVVYGVVDVLVERRIPLKKYLAIAALVLAVLAPLLVKNALLTANPFFPFLGAHFPSPGWDATRYAMVRDEVGMRFHGWRDLLRAPYTFSFSEQGAGGMVGPVFLMFLPFLVRLRLPRQARFSLWFALLLIVASSFWGQAFRYIYIAFALLAGLVAYAYEAHRGRVLRAVLAAVIGFNFVLGAVLLETVYNARQVFFSRQSSAEYIQAAFPAYRVYQVLNTQAAPGARVLVAGECRGFYLQRRYMISSAHDYCILKKYIAVAATAAEFIAAIKADGFDYLVFNYAEFLRLQSYRRLTPQESETLLGFFKRIRPTFQDGTVFLYRLR
jgi:hypothetical protein